MILISIVTAKKSEQNIQLISSTGNHLKFYSLRKKIIRINDIHYSLFKVKDYFIGQIFFGHDDVCNFHLFCDCCLFF